MIHNAYLGHNLSGFGVALGRYNLSRSHRDVPMRDRGFMDALALTHADDPEA